MSERARDPSPAAPFPGLLSAVLVAGVAWSTALVGWLMLQPLGNPSIGIGAATLAGYGVVTALASRELGASDRRRLAFALPSLRHVPGLALLVLAAPLGFGLQALIAGGSAAAGGAHLTEWAAGVTTKAWEVSPVGTIACFVLLVPVLEEWLFRGLIQPGLVQARGTRIGVGVTVVLSAAAFVGLKPSIPAAIPVVATALVWCCALSLVRLWTGSWVASAALRVGLSVWWAATTLPPAAEGAPVGAADPLLMLGAAAGVALGAWLLYRTRVAAPAAAASAPAAEGEETAAIPDLAEKGAPAADAGAAPGWRRLGWPTVGIAVGIGLLVGESMVYVRSILDSFAGGAIAPQLVKCLVLYTAAGAVLDMIFRAVLPARWARHAIVRAIPILLIAYAVEHQFGLFAYGASAAIRVAAAWAWAVHVRWAWPLAVACALYGFTGVAPGPVATPAPTAIASPTPQARSVVLVVLDTVRRDRTSLHGHDRQTTPRLDELAARGVRFDRAHATSCWSIESHASLFTGLLPRVHGATWEHIRLDDEVPTLASVLAANGWQTAGFSANPYITVATGMSRGFGTYVEEWRPYVTRRAFIGLQVLAHLGSGTVDKGGRAVVDGVREWLAERDASRPYFIFVNFMEAHAPYQDAPLARKFAGPGMSAARAEQLGRVSHDAQWLGSPVPQAAVSGIFDLEDGAIASADAYLGEIIDAVGEDAIVIVVSDHGDLVSEHGLYGHMTGLYEPLVHVPFVMAGPGLPKGSVVSGPVSLLDVMPTTLSLMGIPLPVTEGLDLRPAFDGKEIPPDRPVYAEHFRNPGLAMWTQHRPPAELRRLRARRAAVWVGDRKRVVAEDGWDVGYNLAQDPLEMREIVPGSATGLSVTAPTGKVGRPGVPALDPAQLEALKALGYVH